MTDEDPLSDEQLIQEASAPLRVRRDAHYLHLTFNRPEALNALNWAMLEGLRANLTAVRTDPRISAILLRGAGERAFCGGADVKELLRSSKSEAERFIRCLEEILVELNDLSVPIIAVINGHALGAGAYIAAACDIRIATTSARFQFGSVHYGLVLGSWLLPQMLGSSRALELMMTGRTLLAQEAAAIGLVQYLSTPDQIDTLAGELKRQLSDAAPEAVALCKHLVRRDWNAVREVSWKHELEHNLHQAGTPDFMERLRRTINNRHLDILRLPDR